MSSVFDFPAGDRRLESFGFKLTEGGTHNSRTMMLEEITRLVAAVPRDGTVEDYRKAVIEENVLEKPTDTTRQKTFRHLRELYALSDRIPIFAIYRELVRFDPQSCPVLSLLVAWARDPLLRATTPAVLAAGFGDEVTGDSLQQALTETYTHQYSLLSVATTTRNAASSWSQSGHLSGRTKKIRVRVEPRPAALTLALVLGHVNQLASSQLFASIWCRMLDLNSTQARSLAEQAHREALITLRAIGSVVEVGFPMFKQYIQEYS